MTTSNHDVIVVGAGPGGLSAAWELVQAGLRPLVLERTSAVGDVWRSHYDGLRLNTGRRLSRLPGSPLPASSGGWPTRDDLVALLAGMPARGRFSVQTGIEVTRIGWDAATAQWQVSDAAGHLHGGRAVVVATGGARVPVMPAWEGQHEFSGRVLHSSAFRDAKAFAGQRVLVVGCGNSAAEIASRLTAHASAVVCAVRTPPHLLPKSVLGIPMAGWGLLLRHLPERLSDTLLHWLQKTAIGDLAPYGLPLPSRRLSEKFRESQAVPTLYVPFSENVRAGRIRIVGALRRFGKHSVVVDDRVDTPGAPAARPLELSVDSVIAGTGFRSGLEQLIAVPGLIDAQGRPAVTGAAEFAGAPRLYFIGQHNPLTGQLREIRIEASQIARRLQQQLKHAPAAGSAEPMRWRSQALRSD